MKMPRNRRRKGAGRIVFAWIVVAPAVALAQLTYDQVPLGRTVPVQEQIESGMNSRFRLGPVRLLPQLSLVGPTYDNNVLGTTGNEPKVSDWSFTAAAGLGVLVPFSKKVYLSATILPQYIYYHRLSERRQWGGTYGGNIYGFFNRLALEADYSENRSPQYPNTEIQTQVLGDTRAGNARAEVDIGGPWSVYAAGQYQDLTYESLGGPPLVINGVLSLLNRNEGALRGGFRYRFASYFIVGIGAEETRTRFSEQPEAADNDSTAFIMTVHYDRPRLFVNFSGGYRRGREANGSNFPDYDTFTGSGYLTYQLLRSLDVNLNGSRAIYYGFFPSNPYYLGSLGQGGLTLHLGTRVSLSGYGGYGTNTYPVPVAGVQRVDKVTTYGGSLNALLYKTITLTANATHYDYNSNIAAFDQSVFRFTAGLVIGLVAP